MNMDFLGVFRFLLDNFQREGIDFALIGGFALEAQGVVRTTLDIDMLIMSEENTKIKDIMIQVGYELIHESEDVLNFCSNKAALGRVDFLLAHRRYAKAMLERAELKGVLGGKFKIKVLKIEDIIGLKVQSSSNDPARKPQDMADIVSLFKKHYPHMDIKLLEEYFRLFDREEELKAIIREAQKNAQ